MDPMDRCPRDREAGFAAVTENAERTRELQDRVERLQRENAELRARLSSAPPTPVPFPPDEACDNDASQYAQQGLSTEQIQRYSRQLLLRNGFGVGGQRKLLQAKVLIVGAGGIGSTVILYLAAMGIGTLGVMDFDVVEVSNLHRQVIHRQDLVGTNKAHSARLALLSLNPTIDCCTIPEKLTHDNAMHIMEDYDVIVDASDNPYTRYLINDACVLGKKPLVSGSAVELEGQLTVYNHNGGPCYRCLYPKPSVSIGCGRSCSDAGVLGPVPGLIGILQAMEVVKLITGTGETMEHRMLHVNALQTRFDRFNKPPKRAVCIVCGPMATIRSMEDSRQNLEQAAAAASSCAIGSTGVTPMPCISCVDYQQVIGRGDQHVLLDVRVEQQYELCSLQGSINIPLNIIPQELSRIEALSGGARPIYCVCRRGVASTEATRLLLAAKDDYPGIHSVVNIKGGLQAWHKSVDSRFPYY